LDSKISRILIFVKLPRSGTKFTVESRDPHENGDVPRRFLKNKAF